MKKLSVIISLGLSLVLSHFVYAETSLRAGPDPAIKLQQEIDEASEQGKFSYVQKLRLDLAEHFAATGDYADAARQYELILASRPGRSQRVKYFIELGKMRD